MAPDPLAIPEILTRVGFFLPLWVPHPRRRPAFLDKPQDVLNCMLVSKHWYQVMIPILWHTCLEPRVIAAPKSTFERFLLYIRVLETGIHFPAVVLQCTRLLDLALCTQWLPDMCIATSQFPHKNLVRVNPGLRALSWSGRISDSLGRLDPEDFAGQDRLESLELLSWFGTRRSLARILRPVATSLKSLKLHRVQGAGLMMEDQEGGACKDVVGDSANNSKGVGNIGQRQAPARAPLCFPALNHLSYEICWAMSLEFLVRHSPGRESFNFTAGEGTEILNPAAKRYVEQPLISILFQKL
ncbi:hypothetical protein K457DRAFT_121574 [Linnemannia elongata AG-77]|uniref:Uncharacterized protein n=1 Tax=Linnemannia elongata AG-77 TaxID=1314771 RepID=A0A197KDC6_9FUNG|nr:hypothetical protein K457DRAFT_121574 [Linnemannia elongata AG-77]